MAATSERPGPVQVPPELAGGGGTAFEETLTEPSLGGLRRWIPGRAGVKLAARLAVRPDKVARRGAGLAAELARIAAGRSEVAPPRGDRRFMDPAWTGNPAYRRLAQAYLASGRAVDGLVCDANLDWVAERRVRFAGMLVGASASSTFSAALTPTRRRSSTRLKRWKRSPDRSARTPSASARRASCSPPRSPNDKASFRVNRANPPDAEDWLRSASQQPGTWWDDWVAWLSERSGEERRARRTLGGAGHEPLDPAPGNYVRQTAG
jgi:Poly-beta-hydroxybutyrate polymerase (PhaC) N-terminus